MCVNCSALLGGRGGLERNAGHQTITHSRDRLSPVRIRSQINRCGGDPNRMFWTNLMKTLAQRCRRAVVQHSNVGVGWGEGQGCTCSFLLACPSALINTCVMDGLMVFSPQGAKSHNYSGGRREYWFYHCIITTTTTTPPHPPKACSSSCRCRRQGLG